MLRYRNLCLGTLALAVLVLAAPAHAAELGKYLPNDTEAILTVNVPQLLDAPLVKNTFLPRIKEKLKEDECQQILTALGFDPLKDIESLTVAGPVSKDPDKGLIIITGNFDVAKFQKAAEEAAKNHSDNVKITKEGTYKVWEVTGHGVPQLPDTIYVALADKNTMFVTGGKNYVKEALSKAAGKKKTELKKRVAQLVQKANPKESAALMLETTGLANLDIPNVPQDTVKEVVANFKTLTVGVTLAKDVTIQVGIGANSEAKAKELSKIMNTFLIAGPILLKQTAEDRKEIAPFVDVIGDVARAVKVKAKGSTVDVKAVLTPELLKKIGEAFKAFQKAQGGE
jgi:hypothetical protein